MSSAPIYFCTLDTIYDNSLQSRVEAYVIDRIPQGPLSDYTVLQDNRTACDPCQSSMYSSRTGIPNRYALTLPDSVSRAYQSHRRTTYVDTYTLPGFISWLGENGYDTVDMNHVLKQDNTGFWIQYTDSSTEEFRSTRASTTNQRKKNNVVTTNVPPSKRQVGRRVRAGGLRPRR